MRKSILILDDDQLRHRSFRRRYNGNSVVCVLDPIDAAAAMTNVQYDLVHLDHDLGFSHTGETDPAFFGGYSPDPDKTYEMTGYHLVLWMLQMPQDKRPRHVIVHSLNPGGAQKMFSALHGAGFWVNQEPFVNDNPMESLFYIGTMLHERGGPCIGCETGYPKSCKVCAGLLHGHQIGEGPVLERACEDCGTVVPYSEVIDD